MAMGVMEIASITRSQDYTTIKQSEDNKSLMQQSGLVENMKKETEHKTKQVNKGDNAEWQQKKYDAKEKGNGSYEGNGGRKQQKKNEPDGQVVVKGRSSFDIKV